MIANRAGRWLGDRAYPLVLCCILVGFFGLLEWKFPYFFLQDDSRDQQLPAFVHNYRSLLNGELAVYNFHQFLGTTSLATGQASTLYPPVYVGVFLSQWIFGHYFATIDILVILHYGIGAIGFYLFLKQAGLDRVVALLGGVSWPMTAFFVYFGNSWFVITGPAAWMPWLMYLGLLLYQHPSPRTAVALTIVRVLLILMGHAQYFTYSILFEVLFLWVYAAARAVKERNGRGVLTRVGIHIVSLASSVMLTLPLLLPMWQQALASSDRAERMTWELFTEHAYQPGMWLYGLVNPNAERVVQSIYFSVFVGYIPLLLLAALIVLGAWVCRSRVAAIRSLNPLALGLALSAMVAIFWASNFLVTPLIYHVPVLNRFRWPLKLGLYANFFLISLGCVGLFLMFELMNIKNRLRIIAGAVIITLHVGQMTYFYLSRPPSTVRPHIDPVPWDEPLAAQLRDGRVLSVGFHMYEMQTARTLGFNYCTLWGLYGFAGYDPIVSKANAEATLGLNHRAYYNEEYGRGKGIPHLEHFRLWGVSWYVMDRRHYAQNRDLPLTPVHRDNLRVILHDKHARPLFYWKSSGRLPVINHQIGVNHILLRTENDMHDSLVINFLHRPYFRATINGQPISVSATTQNQILLDVPAGAHTIRVWYDDPYYRCGWYAAIAYAAGCGFWLALRSQKKVTTPRNTTDKTDQPATSQPVQRGAHAKR